MNTGVALRRRDPIREWRHGDWLDQAACGSLDPDLFEVHAPDQADPQALATCRTCPVRAECADDAVRTGAAGMVRGGLILYHPAEWHTCGMCGTPFLRPRSQGSNRRRYCADECTNQARRNANLPQPAAAAA